MQLCKALYENVTMEISLYLSKAKEIGDLVKEQSPQISAALDFGPDDDHPSIWVPKVQKSLLGFYKDFPSSESADEALKLYVQGAILESRAEQNNIVKVGLICFVLGIFIGWLVWA